MTPSNTSKMRDFKKFFAQNLNKREKLRSYRDNVSKAVKPFDTQ